MKAGLNKKKEEWEKIKEQFSKQKDIKKETGMDPIVTLEWNLELEFSNENSEEDKANNVSAEEAKEIKHLREIIKKKNQDAAVAAGGSGTGDPNGKKTLMDKLIEHEEGIATECKETHNDDKCKQEQENTGGGRTGEPRAEEEEDHELSDDEDLDDAEGEDGEGDVGAETSAAEEDTETQQEGEAPQKEAVPPATPGVNPCDIVAELFNDTTKFSDACTLKYVTGKNYGWKCVNTTSDKGSEAKRQRRDTEGAHGKSDATTTGSICVPPRRRRLYVTPLTRLAGDNTAASPQGGEAAQPQSPVAVTNSTGSEVKPGESGVANASASSTSTTSSSQLLRDAFIQSAAIETFFLWDRYKKQKEKKPQGDVSPLPLQTIDPNSANGDGEEEEQPPPIQIRER